jgi:multiple sugar transport system permease protein
VASTAGVRTRRARFEPTTWVLLSPWILSLALFGLYPFGFSFILSFFDYSPLRPDQARFLGLTNYAEALRDPVFWKALGNTLVFVFGTIPFTTAIALGLALALSRPFRGRDAFRAGFFLPTVVSVVVISIVWKALYAPEGVLSSLVRALGFTPPAWLLNEHTALPAIMAMDVWAASGYYMIIFLAGLKAIPDELYESASLEGASAWQRFVHVTLPLLKPTFLFVLIVNSIRSLQIFTEVFVMTRGGPLQATLTSVYYLYEQAFYQFRLGYASAIAYLLFALTLALAIVQVRWLKLEGPRA